MGIIFAILSWVGTTPVEKERLIKWQSGLASWNDNFFTRYIESPLKSWLSLGWSSFRVSRISVHVTGVLEKFNKGISLGIILTLSYKGISDGGISSTICRATLVKNTLRLLAIILGSLTKTPSIFNSIGDDFLQFLLMAFFKMDQVFLRFDWALTSSFSKNILLATLITVLYKLR